MKTQQEFVESLMAFKEVCFSRFSNAYSDGKLIELGVDGYGNFKVFKDYEVLKSTSNPAIAVDAFNNLLPDNEKLY